MADFISYGDWVGANQQGARDMTARALEKQQAGTSSAVGDAFKAGQTGADPTNQSMGTYGDFLKLANTGNYNDLGGALGGNSFDAMLVQGAGGDQLRQAQQQFNQQQQGAAAAYASGAKNAAASTPEARAQQAQQSRQAGYGYNTNTTTGQAGFAAELAQGKQAQQSARDAGAKYRLDRERKAFEAQQKQNQFIENGVASILNPAYGIGWASTDFGHGHGTDFSRTVEDPFGLGGNAHSGFGPGGKFGSPLGMGDASQGDPFGQYSNDDSGFAAWLKKNGYDSSGNGNGY